MKVLLPWPPLGWSPTCPCWTTRLDRLACRLSRLLRCSLDGETSLSPLLLSVMGTPPLCLLVWGLPLRMTPMPSLTTRSTRDRLLSRRLKAMLWTAGLSTLGCLGLSSQGQLCCQPGTSPTATPQALMAQSATPLLMDTVGRRASPPDPAPRPTGAACSTLSTRPFSPPLPWTASLLIC